MNEQQNDRDHLRENAAEGGAWGAVVLALLDQLDQAEARIRHHEDTARVLVKEVIAAEDARDEHRRGKVAAEERIAEEKHLRMKATEAATKAEARIKAVEELCDTAPDDAEECDLFEGMRILSRAPKPAWHNAVAVMAVTVGRPERRVFMRDVEPGWWVDADSSYETDELAHVTPLIKAEVTDEMVERARDYMSDQTGQTHSHSAIRGVLSEALSVSDGD